MKSDRNEKYRLININIIINTRISTRSSVPAENYINMLETQVRRPGFARDFSAFKNFSLQPLRGKRSYEGWALRGLVLRGKEREKGKTKKEEKEK